MKAIPTEIRKRIIFLHKKGKTAEEMSEMFGYCVAAIYRVRQQFKERGTLEPQTHTCGRKTLFTPERRALLTNLVAAEPDATLAQLGNRMDRPFRTSTIDLWLQDLGLSFKKNGIRRRARQTRRG
jgi:transposase